MSAVALECDRGHLWPEGAGQREGPSEFTGGVVLEVCPECALPGYPAADWRTKINGLFWALQALPLDRRSCAFARLFGAIEGDCPSAARAWILEALQRAIGAETS